MGLHWYMLSNRGNNSQCQIYTKYSYYTHGTYNIVHAIYHISKIRSHLRDEGRPKTGFTNLVDPRPPFFDIEYLATPKHLHHTIFVTKAIAIFGLQDFNTKTTIFYDAVPFLCWKAKYHFLTLPPQTPSQGFVILWGTQTNLKCLCPNSGKETLAYRPQNVTT